MLTMSGWQICANGIQLPCGCQEWDEFTGSEWEHRRYPCWRHGAPGFAANA